MDTTTRTRRLVLLGALTAATAVHGAAKVPSCNKSDDPGVASIMQSASQCSANANLDIFSIQPMVGNKSFCVCEDTIKQLNTLTTLPACSFDIANTGKRMMLKSYLYKLFAGCPGAQFSSVAAAGSLDTSLSMDGSGTSESAKTVTGSNGKETKGNDPSSKKKKSHGSSDATNDPPAEDSEHKTAAKKSYVTPLAAVLATLLVVGALAGVWIWRRKSTKARAKASDEHEGVISAGSSYNATQSPVSSGKLAILSSDATITMSRIPLEKITFGDRISRGGYGEVYRGTYQSRAVAIKRLLPERRRDMTQINNFLAEIKLMTTLDHERIVQFVGVAWDALTDLCCVLEFMEGGDLRSLLDTFDRSSPPRAYGFDADKTKIALHIAHALTYLHTLDQPVVHRDLKSRNVLLSTNLDAKLTDFGVARAQEDCTMTAAVGTSLWMAPEVLMGQRYNEKADVFSFGVMLSELDSHDLPYAHLSTAVTGGEVRRLPDVAIFQLVSLGKARVQFSPACPASVVELANRCVELDAALRPSASEVLYELQRVLRNPARS